MNQKKHIRGFSLSLFWCLARLEENSVLLFRCFIPQIAVLRYVWPKIYHTDISCDLVSLALLVTHQKDFQCDFKWIMLWKCLYFSVFATEGAQGNQLTNKIDIPTVKTDNYMRFRPPWNTSSAFRSPSCPVLATFRGKDRTLSQCCYGKGHQEILYSTGNLVKKLKIQLQNLFPPGRTQVQEEGIQLCFCYCVSRQAIPSNCRAWSGVRKHDERRGNRFTSGLNSSGKAEQIWIWQRSGNSVWVLDDHG